MYSIFRTASFKKQYKINDNIVELALVQVGNHNSLFK